jgi:hypothetical protein
MGLEPDGVTTRASSRSTRTEARSAAIRVADHVAGQYPHPLDDTDPVSAGRSVAYDRRARADLLGLLDALGITTDQTTTGGTR